jgi:hypothetical protein
MPHHAPQKAPSGRIAATARFLRFHRSPEWMEPDRYEGILQGRRRGALIRINQPPLA